MNIIFKCSKLFSRNYNFHECTNKSVVWYKHTYCHRDTWILDTCSYRAMDLDDETNRCNNTCFPHHSFRFISIASYSAKGLYCVLVGNQQVHGIIITVFYIVTICMFLIECEVKVGLGRTLYYCQKRRVQWQRCSSIAIGAREGS